MKNFMLVTNSAKENCVQAAERVIEILVKHGCTCTKNIYTVENNDGEFMYTDPAQVPKNTDCVLTLGGDGTFLHTAKDLISLDLPIMGINMGRLGYLSEVDLPGFEQALLMIIAGDYAIEERMMLEGDVIRNGERIHRDLCINDIVVGRASPVGVADFDVCVDDDFLNTYASDGIIVSTPTGSTGYNLSCFGPVVMPTAEIILLTPVCAHSFNARSVVFSADVEIEIVQRDKERARKQKKYVSFDGGKEISLGVNDVLKIRKASVFAKKLRTQNTSFIEHLGKKMR